MSIRRASPLTLEYGSLPGRQQSSSIGPYQRNQMIGLMTQTLDILDIKRLCNHSSRRIQNEISLGFPHCPFRPR